jgi:hypothetical protein
MRWFGVAVGIFIASTAMWDLACTLFHPSQHGNVSDWFTLRIWRTSRWITARPSTSVGPLNFLAVILYWAASVIVGFAVIYFAFANQFVLSSGMDVKRFGAHPLAYSFTLSLASLISVGLGIQSNSALLQFAMGCEAVLGFVILSASISWILSVYPVLEHRRSLAHEVTLLHFAEERGLKRLEEMNDDQLQQILLALSEKVTTVRTELSQFPITYYFQERDTKSAIGPALQYLAEVAEQIAARRSKVALAATVLGGAVDDLLDLMTRKYLQKSFASRWEALAAVNTEHDRQPLRRPRGDRAA